MSTPTLRPRAHLEDDAQRAVVEWASWVILPAAADVEPGARVVDYLYAVPNGGKRRNTEAARLIGLGVKPGVSDLVIALGRGGYLGAYLELKRPRAHFATPRGAARAVSPAQRAWLARMHRAGYYTAAVYGAQEAIDHIAEYLSAAPTLEQLQEPHATP